MALTPEQLDQLVQNYAERMVESMDMKCLAQFAYDAICENLSLMNEEDILNDIANGYDEDEIQEMIAEVTVP